MSFAPETETLTPEVLARPEALLRVPVGLASPLWGLFAGAAVSASAWWWMTRWTRPQNLEAMFAQAEAVIEPEMEAFAAPIEETVEEVIEATPEPVLEAIAEATPEPVLEAIVEVTPEPVLEALAPDIVEPAAAAEPAPAPKPRKKAAAPPASDAAD